MSKRYLTAESVCAGHPDKLCDIIADSILEACLRKDKASRVACEVMATKGKIIVAGEISCSEKQPSYIFDLCICTQSKCRYCNWSEYSTGSKKWNKRTVWFDRCWRPRNCVWLCYKGNRRNASPTPCTISQNCKETG